MVTNPLVTMLQYEIQANFALNMELMSEAQGEAVDIYYRRAQMWANLMADAPMETQLREFEAA